MNNKHKKIKLFLRTFYLSSVILFCCFFILLGSAKAYESIRQVGFGEYRKAIEYSDGVLKLFDLEINLYSFSEKET